MLASFKNVTKLTEEQITLEEELLILEATQEDIARSLYSLMKHNNGLFKSEKQGHFLRSSAAPTHNDEYDGLHNHLKDAGVPIDKNKHTHVMMHTQYLNFNPYSQTDGARPGRGARTSNSVFLMDKHGVQAHYKLGRTGADYDPKKTTKTWERPTGVATGGEEHHYNADEEPHMTSKHLGKVGEKITHDVSVERLHNLGPSRFGAGRGPDQYMTVMKTDDGHILHHYGTPPASLKGFRTGQDWKGTVSGEVKKHHVDRNGNNVTILTRPKFNVKSKPEEPSPEFPRY